MKKGKMTAMVCSLMLASSTAGFAGDPGTAGDYFREISIKFVRGIGNILQSPAEIPCAMVYDNREDPGTGLITGLGKGLWYTVRRIWVGVDEVATFIIPMEPTLPTVCKEPQKPQMEMESA